MAIVATIAVLTFVAFNAVLGIRSFENRNERRIAEMARKNCQLQLESVHRDDGEVVYFLPLKNGPLTYESGEPIVDPRTNSPYVWASVDKNGNRIAWTSADEIPRFFAHTTEKDGEGRRWFIVSNGVGAILLSDNQFDWVDHTARVPLP